VKRFTPRGLDYIPVLEYLQMAGRAGRPKYDKVGESIIITSSDLEQETVTEKYINGEPEEIYSKLAVEPVLRTYVLSLVATRIVKTKKRLYEFFSKTFWAHHYKDMEQLQFIIEKIKTQLEDWEFIKTTGGKASGDFVAANEIGEEKLTATPIGKRVAELYIDPLTANFFLSCFKRINIKFLREISFIQMVSHTLEMRPLLKTRQKDMEEIDGKIIEYTDYLIDLEPSMYHYDYQEFLDSGEIHQSVVVSCSTVFPLCV